MKHLNQTANINFVLIFNLLMMVAAAHASALDCNKSLGLESASGAGCTASEMRAGEPESSGAQKIIPAPLTDTAAAGFHVNQARTASAVPESAPLLVLIGALLAVVLVRAKSCNTK